jgi:hypothetical protein
LENGLSSSASGAQEIKKLAKKKIARTTQDFFMFNS